MVKKVLPLVIAFLTALNCFSQQPTRIQLISSDSAKVIGPGITSAIHPLFLHEGSTLAADSVRFDQTQNTIDAFGHVVITQPGGKLIYSDLLNYNGNTRLAILTRQVRMVDGDATLTTDYFTYNLGTKIGNYTTGGKIVHTKGDMLTSKTGYYFGNTRDAYFRYDVVLTSKEAIIKADTLRYNTLSRVANIYGPTNIYRAKDTIYTELGNYNTETEQANGYKNNLYRQGSRILKSDSGFYDNKNGIGKVRSNIIFYDSQEKIAMYGDVGLYARADSSIVLTKNAYIAFATQDSAKVDTIWMGADTLYSKVILRKDFIAAKRPVPSSFVTINNPVILGLINRKSQADKIPLVTNQSTSKAPALRDTTSVSADTAKTRVVFAYHHVKIFKSDMQAVADSVSYGYADSVIRTYGNPIVWAQGAQLSGDTILMQLKDRKLDNMLIQQNGFIAMTEGDSTRFNQIKGRILTGKFADNQLKDMLVDGNAERVYFIKDSIDFTSMNHTLSSGMYFEFGNKKLLRMYSMKPDGKQIPIKDVNNDNSILRGFIWKPESRPKSKDEIIPAKESKPAVAETPVKEVKPPAKAVAKPATKPATKAVVAPAKKN